MLIYPTALLHKSSLLAFPSSQFFDSGLIPRHREDGKARRLDLCNKTIPNPVQASAFKSPSDKICRHASGSTGCTDRREPLRNSSMSLRGTS